MHLSFWKFLYIMMGNLRSNLPEDCVIGNKKIYSTLLKAPNCVMRKYDLGHIKLWFLMADSVAELEAMHLSFIQCSAILWGFTLKKKSLISPSFTFVTCHRHHPGLHSHSSRLQHGCAPRVCSHTHSSTSSPPPPPSSPWLLASSCQQPKGSKEKIKE